MPRRMAGWGLVWALAIPLVACQPAEQEAGGGAGGQVQAERPLATVETPGDHYEEAYTSLAEAHISLVQGDWDEAAKQMREVRENLDGMRRNEGEALPAVVTSRINELQRAALGLDQMIANRNPAAIEQSRSMMTTFTRESSLAQVGREGGGAGTGVPENR